MSRQMQSIVIDAAVLLNDRFRSVRPRGSLTS